MAGHRLDPDSLGDHIDRLYRAAWSLTGSREEAEDLVQETFARVLARPRWVTRANDVGYLLSALTNTHRSRRRSRQRRPVLVPALEDDQLADVRAGATPERHLETSELYAAIAELPGEFREAVVAVDVVGLSYREAAEHLRVPEATIATRVHRGRKRLAARLG
ncbi:RNA polymerase sigma factor [Conexibacter sp. DBS9H8]|uniref:RNA polymerase sigma factor n=1 Tax=Conexibacter sp. DBS9H8 TaxID=2937801 RepID=UPI00200CD300|nr:RNA polymerase sigma factor [Conexibacter sp. DBS9H8]